eukprot:gene13141-13271_t
MVDKYGALLRAVDEYGHNTHFSPADEARLKTSPESTSYLPPNSAVYRKWLAENQANQAAWLSWLVMAVIGIAVGLTAWSMQMFIDAMLDIKFDFIKKQLAHHQPGAATGWLVNSINNSSGSVLSGIHAINSIRWLWQVVQPLTDISESRLAMSWAIIWQVLPAWLFMVAFSVAAAGLSTLLVVTVAPAAAGSGIPEVMAYLNGCAMPHLLATPTVLVKFAGSCLLMLAGLPLGMEGPLIHIGAATGAAISKGSWIPGPLGRLLWQFRGPQAERDFVAAGVAAGLAAAFSAPLGGLLFAVEEMVHFGDLSGGFCSKALLACTTALLTRNILTSALLSLRQGAPFGWFDHDIIFEAGVNVPSHLLMLVPAAILGGLGGILGAAFTELLLQVNAARRRIVQGRKLLQLLEPCLLALVWSSMGTSSIVPAEDQEASSAAAGQVAAGLDRSRGASGVRDRLAGTDSQPHYNVLASLMLSGTEKALQQVLTRGTAGTFTAGSVLVMMLYSLIGAALGAGTSAPSGLFIPMLLIGACLGRCMGVSLVALAHALQLPLIGALALIGAGAFMSGSTRLVVAFAAICVEISNDVNVLPGVLVAVLVAKWVGQHFTPSIYHRLLHFKGLPFLPAKPDLMAAGSANPELLDLVPISRVMISPVVTLPPCPTVWELYQLLQGTSHAAFPVVESATHTLPVHTTHVGQDTTGAAAAAVQAGIPAMPSAACPASSLAGTEGDELQPPLAGQGLQAALPKGGRVLGLIDHSSLEVLLSCVVEEFAEDFAGGHRNLQLLQGGAGQLDLQGDLDDHHSDDSSEEVDFDSEPPMLLDVPYDQLLPETLRLSGQYQRPTHTWVHSSYSLLRGYNLFRGLGLRHLLVTDKHNRVLGMVTRIDLMHHSCGMNRLLVAGKSESTVLMQFCQKV